MAKKDLKQKIQTKESLKELRQKKQKHLNQAKKLKRQRVEDTALPKKNQESEADRKYLIKRNNIP